MGSGEEARGIAWFLSPHMTTQVISCKTLSVGAPKLPDELIKPIPQEAAMSVQSRIA